jgi:phosphoglycolate phosphatase
MHLLFDLDGTLTDSRPGIINCLQHTLAVHDLPVPPAEDLLWCIGPPLQQSLAKLVGPDLPHLHESALFHYRERYSEIGLFENEVYPGVEEMLIEVQALGCTLHVATSKAEVYAKRIVSHFGLDPFFVSVTGSELDGRRSDKAEIIAHILETHHIDRTQAIMIGDREHDMIGASKNDISAIGALWGYGSGRELIESGATLCARIPGLIAELVTSMR